MSTMSMTCKSSAKTSCILCTIWTRNGKPWTKMSWIISVQSLTPSSSSLSRNTESQSLICQTWHQLNILLTRDPSSKVSVSSNNSSMTLRLETTRRSKSSSLPIRPQSSCSNRSRPSCHHLIQTKSLSSTSMTLDC